MRVFKVWGLAVLMLTGVCGAVFCQNPQEMLAKALELDKSSEYENWKYIISNTGVEPGEDEVTHMVEGFDPSSKNGSLWNLISVNGEKPDAKDVRKYLNHKKQDRGFRPDYFLSDMDMGSLELVSEDEEFVVLRCNMRVPGKKADLESNFHIDRKSGTLALVDIVNRDAFSPQFGVKVKDYALKIEFDRHKDSGLLFPFKSQESYSGSFMKVKTISSNTVSVYEGFEKIT